MLGGGGRVLVPKPYVPIASPRTWVRSLAVMPAAEAA